MCKDKNVNWAIFSDKYGVWFSHEKHNWYEESPNDVTESEFQVLLENIDSSLKDFVEIIFYRPNERRFHRL